jgi:quinolinate synthase
MIVFCGVRFMAETRKYSRLPKSSPSYRRSWVPHGGYDYRRRIRDIKAKHPGALAVCYVNSTAEVKAECDIAVTSANAVRIVKTLPNDREIIFVPDRNLGAFVSGNPGVTRIVAGLLSTHERITPEDIRNRKEEYPERLFSFIRNASWIRLKKPTRF